ncbi:MAG: ATP-binding protein [Thermodesulfobacteriota bacterium]
MKKIPIPFLVRKTLPLVYTLAVLLTILIVFVGYSTWRQISQVLSDQFNQQQLILARKISDHVQNQMTHLQITLLGLRQIWEKELFDIVLQPERIFSPFQNLMPGDLLAIMALDRDGRVIGQVRSPEWTAGSIPLPLTPTLIPYRESESGDHRVWVGRTMAQGGKWVLPMAVPFENKRQDQIAGALVFIIDAIHMAKKADEGVISGKSGYPWIINSNGIFMDHFDPEFVGRNIFVVRGLKNPRISYKKIDDLTRNELLKKKEGTSTYVTGWHRELIKVTDKLVAYTPIPFYETPDRKGQKRLGPAAEFWSVAVVAPVKEVSGLVRSLIMDQAFLIVIFQLIVIFSTGLFVFISNRWSRYLKIEVDNKTEELRRSQEKLVHSERLAAVGSMAGHVSHEIKNPLMAIGGLAGQLKRSPQLGEKEKAKLEIITSEIARLEKILIDVRDFTRPTIPKKSKAQINDMVRDQVHLFNPLFTEQHIEVKTELAPSLPEFNFDPEQIKQVLLNLTKNAVEAMPEGGSLTLATERDQDSVLIRITDTGPGIEPEIKENLFRPFITNKKKGTGLGLAVSYKLIQDHNGDIRVETSPRGTTMTVVLPLENESDI